MPNWCCTDYRFYADTEKGKEQIKKMYATLAESISDKKRVIKSDFGNQWLGNVILEFCPQHLILTKDSIRCEYTGSIPFRGSVTYLSEPGDCDDDMFMLQTETAWEPANEIWDMILDEYGFDDIKYVYQAEEPGNCLYINSDVEGRYFTDRIHIEVYISDDFYCWDNQYFANKDEALEYLNQLICDLRREYKAHPEKYRLPEGYSAGTLRKQRSFEKALVLIENNLFGSIDSVDADSYIYCHEYTMN